VGDQVIADDVALAAMRAKLDRPLGVSATNRQPLPASKPGPSARVLEMNCWA